jgi:hypothetical protein
MMSDVIDHIASRKNIYAGSFISINPYHITNYSAVLWRQLRRGYTPLFPGNSTALHNLNPSIRSQQFEHPTHSRVAAS